MVGSTIPNDFFPRCRGRHVPGGFNPNVASGASPAQLPRWRFSDATRLTTRRGLHARLGRCDAGVSGVAASSSPWTVATWRVHSGAQRMRRRRCEARPSLAVSISTPRGAVVGNSAMSSAGNGGAVQAAARGECVCVTVSEKACGGGALWAGTQRCAL